jgi:hypothetical protein
MSIDEIRDGICDSLCSIEGHNLWDKILEETYPANYGFEVESVVVKRNDIWVDVPERTFTFKNLHMTFSARLGGSNQDDGYDEDFHFEFTGSGSFIFKKNKESIQVKHIDLYENQDLDLYGESKSRVD